MSRRIVVIALLAGLAFTAACGTNKKVNNPLADVSSKQPDKVLFDRAMDALKHNRFDVARLALETLINTYPDSEYIARAKLAVAIPGMRKVVPLPWGKPKSNTRISSLSSPTCRKRRKLS